MKKIKIAVLGVGLMGKQHLIAIKKSNRASLHSIIDINKTSIKFAKQYRVPFYTNSEAILGTDKPDAVIVATPNQFHQKHTIKLLNNKIPVLLEKPISNNIQKAKKIINSSIKNKTHLLIGYHRRHNSIVTIVKKKIDSGKLGKVVTANVMCWLYKNKDW